MLRAAAAFIENAKLSNVKENPNKVCSTPSFLNLSLDEIPLQCKSRSIDNLKLTGYIEIIIPVRALKLPVLRQTFLFVIAIRISVVTVCSQNHNRQNKIELRC